MFKYDFFKQNRVSPVRITIHHQWRITIDHDEHVTIHHYYRVTIDHAAAFFTKTTHLFLCTAPALGAGGAGLVVSNTQHRLRDRRSLTCTAGRLRLAAAGGPGRACLRPTTIWKGRARLAWLGWSWLARCRAKLPKN